QRSDGVSAEWIQRGSVQGVRAHGCARRVSRDGFTTSLDRAPLKPLGSAQNRRESFERKRRRGAARRPLPPKIKSRGWTAAPTKTKSDGAGAAPTGVSR